MREASSKAFLLAALAVLAITGCALGRGPQPAAGAAIPGPSARAGAEFMHGRLFELRGRLREAAEAYERAVAWDPEAAQLHRHLAQVWARLGEPDRALRHAEQAYALEPGDEVMRQVLVALYLGRKEFGKAAELLEPAFREDRLSGQGLFAFFNIHIQNGDFEAAERVAEKLIAEDPGKLRGYMALGSALESQGRYDEAELALRQGLEQGPRHPGAYDALASLRRRRGDTDAELAVLREKLVEFPGDPVALMRISLIYDEQGDRETAVETLESLVALQPDHLGAQFQLGFLYYQQDRHADSVARFERILTVAPPEQSSLLVYEVRYFLGVVHYDAGSYEAAIASLEVVPSEADRFADARMLMARAYESLERFDEALVEARRAVLASPATRSLKISLAGLMQRGGDFEGAVELIEDLIEAEPDDSNLYYDLGLTYAEAGHETKVLDFMREALARDPNHANALNYIGYTWAEQGERLEEAERMIRRAVALKPEDGYIVDSLGWVLYRQGLKLLAEGHTEEARAALTDAVKQLEHSASLMDREDPIVTWHLGDAYRSVSRFADALGAYQRALRLDPKEADAEKIRRSIELLEVQLEEASSGTQR